MMRQWLSNAITGNCPAWPFASEQDLAALISQADEQGVCALLHERISSDEVLANQLPLEFREDIARLAREKALQSLMREHECRRLLAQLQQAGLPALLLKGSALAYWAYDTPHLRERGDIDLFLRNKADVDVMVKLLAEMKFELVETALPGDLIGFEVTCRRDKQNGAPLEIDLHWQLSNTPMFAFRFTFDELMHDAIALPTLAVNAYGLAMIAAYLHACMHRIQNISIQCENNLKWLYDLHVLGKKFSANDWQALASMAIEKKLAGICLDGALAAASCFGALMPPPIAEKLLAAAKHETMDVSKMHRWLYIQRMNFIAYPKMRQRLGWLRQRLLPDLVFMQTYYGEGQGFWRMLASRLRVGVRRFWQGL